MRKRGGRPLRTGGVTGVPLLPVFGPRAGSRSWGRTERRVGAGPAYLLLHVPPPSLPPTLVARQSRGSKTLGVPSPTSSGSGAQRCGGGPGQGCHAGLWTRWRRKRPGPARVGVPRGAAAATPSDPLDWRRHLWCGTTFRPPDTPPLGPPSPLLRSFLRVSAPSPLPAALLPTRNPIHLSRDQTLRNNLRVGTGTETLSVI